MINKKLSTKDQDILSKLKNILINNREFNLYKIKLILKLNDRELFSSIKNLWWDHNIINIYADLGDRKDLVIEIDNNLIYLNINNFSKTSLRNLILLVFLFNNNIMNLLVNDLFIPAGLYEADYMKNYLLNKQDNKIKEVEIKKNELRQKANSLIEYFYSKLKLKTGFKLTPSLRETEYYKARNFIKSQPNFTLDEMKDAVDWFLDHDFWNQYITNIYAFSKHFIKYILSKQKTNKNIKIL